MAPLHTWAGLLAGWLLYFMFVTGTAGYLDTEIDRWMRPELPVAQYPLPAAATAQAALAYLDAHATGADRWTIQLPVDRNEPHLSVSWQPAGGQAPQSAWLDGRSGAPIAVRATAGGQALYQLHWRLHYLPRAAAEALVALASMALLLGLLTGIVVHRRLFADFFMLRLGKGQRSWLDAHNLMSVVALPFQLMISYSGLVFLMFSVMPLIATAWYAAPAPPAGTAGAAGAVGAFYAELLPPLAPAAPAGRPAPLAPLAAVLDDAQSRLGASRVSVLEIRHPGDAHARITVIGNFAQGPRRSADLLVYDGASGALLARRPAWQSTPRATRDVLLGLHEGLFAGPLLRALYLLAGLLGSAMVATGLVLWSVKRRERALRAGRPAPPGQALVERLNVAAIFGLPGALAAYLWANRLLPLELPGRAALEMDALFLAWLALAVHALRTAPATAWRQQAGVAALGFAGVPLLNALTTQRHLGHSLAAGDWVMAGVDLGALGLACAFALVARGMGRRAG